MEKKWCLILWKEKIVHLKAINNIQIYNNMFVRHIDFFHKPTVLQYLYNHTLIWYYIETIVGYSDWVAIETIHFFFAF